MPSAIVHRLNVKELHSSATVMAENVACQSCKDGGYLETLFFSSKYCIILPEKRTITYDESAVFVINALARS